MRQSLVDRQGVLDALTDVSHASVTLGVISRSGTKTVIRLFKIIRRTTWHKQHGNGPARRSAEGPRKANPKYKRHSRQPWTDKEVKQLRGLAKANTPTGVISLKMERPPASISGKAQREGISLKPINRSPYNRREKSARR
ncbi:hypothetical protein [Bradyrhizobium genosp. L]|uniref:hypothetical protein n=1 Tax=Bradyrhizobium genosp. L TaxID=83637 RepID=UPI001FF02849|nr:hypothetical protein [Bradyrhizobium genosp. L]